MSKNEPSIALVDLESPLPEETSDWHAGHCATHEFSYTPYLSLRAATPLRVATGRMKFYGGDPAPYDEKWAESVPQLVHNLSSLVAERKKQELRLNLFQLGVDALEKRVHRLESVQTKIIPIDTLLPEPYVVTKPILVSVFSIDGGFQAGWFDANIYGTGCNEEEAISNLKEMVLDVFDSFSEEPIDSFSEEPIDSLGREPKRQLTILKHYIQKSA